MLRCSARALWVASLLLAPAFAETGSRWRALFAEGCRLYIADRIQAAVTKLEEARQTAELEHDKTAQIDNTLGSTYLAAGRLDEAKRAFERATERGKTAATEEPGLRPALLNNLAALEWASQRLSSAEQYSRESLALWQSTGLTNVAEYALALANAGTIAMTQGRTGEAVRLLEAAVAALGQTVPPADPRLVRTRIALGGAYRDAFELAKAEAAYAAIPRDAPDLAEKFPRSNAQWLTGFASLRAVQGRYAEAERLLREAIAAEQAAAAGDVVALAAMRSQLGSVLRNQGERARAEEQLKQAIAALQKAGIRGRAQLPAATNNLALLYMDAKEFSSAAELLRKAIALWQADLGPSHPHTISAQINLAALYQRQHKLVESAALYRKALDLQGRAETRNDVDYARNLHSLGAVEFFRKKYGASEELLRSALRLQVRDNRTPALDVALTEEDLAQVLWTKHQLQEAEQLDGKALARLKELWGAEDPRLIERLLRYSQLLHENQHYAQAAEAETLAVKIKVRRAIVDSRTKAS